MKTPILRCASLLAILVALGLVVHAQDPFAEKRIEVRSDSRTQGATTHQDIDCKIVRRAEDRYGLECKLTLSGRVQKDLVFVETFLRLNNTNQFSSALHTWPDRKDSSKAIASFIIQSQYLRESSLSVLCKHDDEITRYAIALSNITVHALDRSPFTYTVKADDDLRSISMMFGVPSSMLKEANGLKDDKLTVGQKLTIPRM